MIEKLRKEIFWSIELAALGVLFFILVVYNGVQYTQNEQEEWQMLSFILEINGGPAMPGEDGIGPENERRMKGPGHGGREAARLIDNLVDDEIAIVEVDDGEISIHTPGFLVEYGTEKQEELIEKILSSQKEQGMAGHIKYRLCASGEHTVIVLLDRGYFNQEDLQLAGVSLLGLLLAGALFALIAHQLSVRIVRPVEETIRSQKQFIADASHELKTPVSVILANISVLEKEIGGNRWLSYIQEQGKRMTELVSSLLQLSRLDYAEDNLSIRKEHISYDLSEAVYETALPFESIAFEQGISYEVQIPEHIMAFGRPEDLKQIVGILLDNAMKNSGKNESVTLSVLEETRRKRLKSMRAISIHVQNTGAEISKESLPYIFNRFYKTDDARTYTENSFGLGLAIAKSLAEQNGGSITVSSGQKKTEFVVTLVSKME